MAFKRKDPAQLQAQLQALKGGSSFQDDENEWKLTTDKAGNGSATIRFLPGKTDDDLPFVKLVNHGFKKNGKWYIENCTSTHGDYDSCPVCKYMSANDTYNTNEEEYKLLKRKTSYWANILVIKDPANPDNEGKVFKFRFGQKIMDKINAMVDVDAGLGETPVDVTCPFEGANFIMKVKRVSKFLNYDECKFSKQSEIPNIDDEAYADKLQKSMHDISAVAGKDKFKSFSELEASFKRVMGGSSSASASTLADELESELDAYDGKSLDDLDNELDSVMGSAKSSSNKSDDEFDDLDDLLDDLD